MDANAFAGFQSGDEYVLKITSENTIAWFDGQPGEVTGGEFRIRLGAGRFLLSLYGPGVGTKAGDSGSLSFRVSAGEPEEGRRFLSALRAGEMEWLGPERQIPARATLIGERFLRDSKDATRLVLDQIGSDLYTAPEEHRDHFDGTFEGMITINNSVNNTGDGPPLFLAYGRFRLGGGRRISEAAIELSGPLYLSRRLLSAEAVANSLQGHAAKSAASPVTANLDSEIVAVENRRTLRIRRVFFRNNGQVTGTRSNVQVDAARTIWRMACIDIEEDDESPQILDDPQRMTSGDVGFIVGALQDSPPPGVIPVFFVDNQLVGGAGTIVGTAGAVALPGTGLDKVVVSDHWSRISSAGAVLENPNLLAHELGHVLGGTHPDETIPGYWTADDDTVLKASNRPWKLTPGDITLNNCLLAWNVALDTSVQPLPDCIMMPSM